MKHLIYILSLLTFLSGCSKEEIVDKSKGIAIQLSTRYSNDIGTLSESDSDNTVTTLSGYICEDGVVKWVSHNLKSTSGEVWLPYEYRSGTLYLLANKSLCPEAEKIVVGSAESELTELNAVLGEYRAPSSLLMSNVIDVPSLEASENLAINLRRNVARFDLFVDHSVVIHSISINGIPVSGAVFSNGTTILPLETKTLELTFTEDQPATNQCLFYCQEFVESNQTPLTITIDATYNGHHAKSQSTISMIQRNYLYRLRVSAPNGVVTSDITYADMEEGDDVSVDKPAQTPIFIDASGSALPANCQLSDDKRKLEFDYHGGQATIALTGTAPIKLISSHASIKDFSVTPETDGRFLINVGTYLSELGTEFPAAIMYFAAEGDEEIPSRYQSIVVVAANFAPFDVVTIGGTEWAQVNANTASSTAYLMTGINTDYRERYKNKWNTYCAQGCQWGPRPGDANGNIKRYAAWETAWGVYYQTLPGINGSIIDGNNCRAWDGLCPTGWRLPTSEEFSRIWPPKNTTITENEKTSYTTTLGDFTASIETLGKQCLIISDGVNEVIFPIAGFRGANGAHYIDGVYTYDYLGWNTGTETYYWCYNRSTNNNVMVYGIKDKVSTSGDHDPANWNQVRCVRDIKN